MNLFTLFAKVSIDTSGVKNAEKQVKNSAEGMKNALSKSSSSAVSLAGTFTNAWTGAVNVISGLGSAFSKGIDVMFDGVTALNKGLLEVAEIATQGLETLVKYSTDVGASFEAQMSKVSAISGAVGSDFDALENKAKELGSSTKFTATEVAQGFEYMAMAGWKTNSMLDGITPLLNLAAAGGESLAKTSDIVTDALTAFKQPASEAAHFADVLAAAASNSNTNISMLGQSFKYAGAVAGTLGYSVDDTALALGLMANSGVKASSAGTQLRRSLSSLAKGVTLAGKYIGEISVSSADANGKMKPLRQTIDELRSAFANMTDQEKELNAETIAQKTGMPGLLAIVNASAEDYNKLADAIDNATGRAEEMSATMIDNLKGSLAIMKSAAEGFGLAVYDYIGTPIRDVVDVASDEIPNLTKALSKGGIDGYNSLIQAIQGVLTRLAVNIDTYAPEMIRKGRDLIVSFLKGLSSGNSLPFIYSAVSNITTALVDAFTKIYPEFLKVGVVLIDGITNSLNNTTKINDMKNAFFAMINKTINILSKSNLLKDFSLFAKNVIVAIAKGISDNLQFLINTANSIITTLTETLFNTSNILAFMDFAVETIKTIVNGFKGNGDKLIEGASTIIFTLIDYILEYIPAVVEVGLQIINKIVESIGDHSEDLAKAVIKCVMKIVDKLTEPNTNKRLIDAATSLVANLVQGIVESLPTIIDVTSDIIDNIALGIDMNMGTIENIGETLFTGIVNGFKNGWEEFKKQEVGEALKNLVLGEYTNTGFNVDVSNKSSSLGAKTGEKFRDLISPFDVSNKAGQWVGGKVTDVVSSFNTSKTMTETAQTKPYPYREGTPINVSLYPSAEAYARVLISGQNFNDVVTGGKW